MTLNRDESKRCSYSITACRDEAEMARERERESVCDIQRDFEEEREDGTGNSSTRIRNTFYHCIEGCNYLVKRSS